MKLSELARPKDNLHVDELSDSFQKCLRKFLTTGGAWLATFLYEIKGFVTHDEPAWYARVNSAGKTLHVVITGTGTELDDVDETDVADAGWHFERKDAPVEVTYTFTVDAHELTKAVLDAEGDDETMFERSQDLAEFLKSHVEVSAKVTGTYAKFT